MRPQVRYSTTSRIIITTYGASLMLHGVVYDVMWPQDRRSPGSASSSCCARTRCRPPPFLKNSRYDTISANSKLRWFLLFTVLLLGTVSRSPECSSGARGRGGGASRREAWRGCPRSASSHRAREPCAADIAHRGGGSRSFPRASQWSNRTAAS